jgi:hypothetical protein
VRRLAEAEFFPERAPRQTLCDAGAVADFLHRRCAEGCHNAAKLFAELKNQGFQGSYHMVWRWLVRRRGGTRRTLSSAAAATPAQLRLSPRQIVRLLLRPEAELDQAGRELRDRLKLKTAPCNRLPTSVDAFKRC